MSCNLPRIYIGGVGHLSHIKHSIFTHISSPLLRFRPASGARERTLPRIYSGAKSGLCNSARNGRTPPRATAQIAQARALLALHAREGGEARTPSRTGRRHAAQPISPHTSPSAHAQRRPSAASQSRVLVSHHTPVRGDLSPAAGMRSYARVSARWLARGDQLGLAPALRASDCSFSV